MTLDSFWGQLQILEQKLVWISSGGDGDNDSGGENESPSPQPPAKKKFFFRLYLGSTDLHHEPLPRFYGSFDDPLLPKRFQVVSGHSYFYREREAFVFSTFGA